MRSLTRPASSARLILPALTIALGLTAAGRAEAQAIPDMAQRSGLIGRFIPAMTTNLPSDPHRDNFYGTRYGDFATGGKYNNFLRGGGLYGLTLDPGCVSCTAPQFQGAPGRSTAGLPGCQPGFKTGFGRIGQGFLQPFRPLGHYYQNGCYVPIYDLDPIVPGPGPDLWPFYLQGFHGG